MSWIGSMCPRPRSWPDEEAISPTDRPSEASSSVRVSSLPPQDTFTYPRLHDPMPTVAKRATPRKEHQ